MGSYQQLISSIGNKLFPPTMYLSVQLRMFWSLEHPGCEVHWEVPDTGSRKERQQPHSPGIAEPSDKKEINTLEIRGPVLVPWLAATCQDGLELGLLERQSKGVRQRRLVQRPLGSFFQPKLFLVQIWWHSILVSSFTYHTLKNILFTHVRKVSATGSRTMWLRHSITHWKD